MLSDSHPVLKKNSMDTYPLDINSKILPQPRTSPGSVAISSSGSSDQSQHFAPLTVAPSCWCLSECRRVCVEASVCLFLATLCGQPTFQSTAHFISATTSQSTADKTGVWPGVMWWEWKWDGDPCFPHTLQTVHTNPTSGLCNTVLFWSWFFS